MGRGLLAIKSNGMVRLQEDWEACSKMAFVSQADCFNILQINTNQVFLFMLSTGLRKPQWSISKMYYFNLGGIREIDGDNEGVCPPKYSLLLTQAQAYL